MKKIIQFTVIGVVGLFVLIQFVPYGRAHTNPPTVMEPNWDSPETKALADRACLDCHSNQTVWPWYSNIAPVSWLVQHDVDEARGAINFSDWGNGALFDEGQAEVIKTFGEVMDGNEMPPIQFMPAHPEARLTDAERAQLRDGLVATAQNTP